jgi:hypothetical protein
MNIDQLIDMLHEYEDGELNEWSQMYLKDEFLELSEKLHREGIEEGHRYDGMMLIVKQGDDLPQPFTKMTMESPITNEKYTIHIKEITQLRYNKNGDLIVEVLAKKENQ